MLGSRSRLLGSKFQREMRRKNAKKKTTQAQPNNLREGMDRIKINKVLELFLGEVGP